jgi:hypothetical protein
MRDHDLLCCCFIGPSSCIVGGRGRWSVVVCGLAQNTPSMYLGVFVTKIQGSSLTSRWGLGLAGDTTKGMVVEQNRYKKVSCKKCTNGG